MCTASRMITLLRRLQSLRIMQRMGSDIPYFTSKGVLPHDFALTFEQLEASVLVLRPGRGAWDEDWRHKLVRMAKVLVSHLWEVGIEEFYLDGSFVERKPHPNDIDGYFVCQVA